jgi:hypothetical protein
MTPAYSQQHFIAAVTAELSSSSVEDPEITRCDVIRCRTPSETGEGAPPEGKSAPPIPDLFLPPGASAAALATVVASVPVLDTAHRSSDRELQVCASPVL